MTILCTRIFVFFLQPFFQPIPPQIKGGRDTSNQLLRFEIFYFNHINVRCDIPKDLRCLQNGLRIPAGEELRHQVSGHQLVPAWVQLHHSDQHIKRCK